MFEKLQETIVPAVVHSLYSIVYLLFILPLALWCKAIERLAQQKESGALDISQIDTPWPYFTFLKNLLLEFLIDFFAMISYPIGVLVALFMLTQHDGIILFVGCLIGTYYTPMYFAFLHDTIQFCILPIRKLLSWLRKPAQHLDLNVKG